MGLRQRIEALVSQPQLGIPVAALLALLPLPHWPGVLLALLIVLRSGGLVSYVGYVLVLAAAYMSEQRYSLSGMTETIGPFLTLFVPMGVMAVVLRMTRHLATSLESGAYTLIAVIGAAYVLIGAPSLESVTAFFNCRRELLGGYSEVDAMAAMTDMTTTQATMYLMLVWPILFFAFQTMLLLMARYCQALLFYRGGFKKDFREMRLSKLSAVVFGVLFILGNFLPQGKQMLPDSMEYVIIFQLGAVALGLLVFVGLGMVHWYIGYKQVGAWVIAMLYASILFLGPVMLPALAVVALADAGWNLRPRVRGSAAG